MKEEPKIWTSYDEKDDRLIAYFNQTIYKNNPPIEEVDNVIAEIKKTLQAPKDSLSIPHYYIKKVELYDTRNYLEIYFGKNSHEHFKISDEKKRNEIFDFLALNLPNAISNTEKYSMLKAGIKPLIAFVVVSLIFSWTLYVALDIETGYEYEIKGSPNSLAGAVLALASLGSTKVILLFSAFLSVAIMAFILKARKPPVVRTIKIER